MNKYIVGIVPQNKKDAANIDADKVNKGKTGKTFTIPLWPLKADTQKDLPTYTWFCWWMSDEEEKEIRKDFDPADPTNPTNKNSSKIYDLSKGWIAETILADNNLKTIEIDMESKAKTKGV